ncbi:MAG TPA: GntR family transcriptional regulator [Chloroflexota bacterium]|nr:GntR family transcriptional regulator [Chloroflexota bacterium]
MHEDELRGPHYLRIARRLRAGIEGGVYLAGQRLPAQRELSRQFDVTPMTLRQALQLLEREGLLVSRQGAGTYVAAHPAEYDLRALRSFAQEMAARGQNLTTRVLSTRLVHGQREAAGALEVGAREALFRLERLRLLDGLPVVYQRSYLPAGLGARLSRARIESHSLYDLLREDLELRVVHARERLRPVNLAARDAALLAKAPGVPALLSIRTTYAPGDRPVLYDEAFMPGDRLEITADRYVEGLNMRYEVLDVAG